MGGQGTSNHHLQSDTHFKIQKLYKLKFIKHKLRSKNKDYLALHTLNLQAQRISQYIEGWARGAI